MKKTKIVIAGFILTIMFAMLVGIPLAFARGGGGGGHGGGGHASGHAGGEGHSSAHIGSVHESEGGHSSSYHEETHVVPNTYYVGHGSSYHDLCPNGVEKTEEQGASDVSVTCKGDSGVASILGAFVVLGILAVVLAWLLPF
jgi:hypothetical protein